MSPQKQLTTLSDLLERRNNAKRVLRQAEKEVEEFVAATQIVAQEANNRPLPAVERTPGVRAAVRDLLSRHALFVQRAD